MPKRRKKPSNPKSHLTIATLIAVAIYSPLFTGCSKSTENIVDENSSSQLETEEFEELETVDDETTDVSLTEEAEELVYDEITRADGVIDDSDSTSILDYLNNELEIPVVLDGSNDSGGFRDYSGRKYDDNGDIVFSYEVRTTTGAEIKYASFSSVDRELLLGCYEHLGIDSPTDIEELVDNFDNETKFICEKDYTIFLRYSSDDNMTELKFDAPNDDYDACYN